ncbi:ABC transporter permease subunit [Sinorhizobium medicae]|uniref:Binding-protein-dependent transport systems inner membrane component n=2 Tax=Sinorhizobium medicae TaxID=110321 RepID=A6UKK0_SINMW|nr:ABC transporter permease [Sinorhizobium medicae]ABR64180.1 binding-protein-dependent transport systems inner membrane component [Sinorhizobium medicae WSM419]MDX0409037.1 ABC transporter permease subunit [Sinorhizobium medicae]MDX0421033.1 ABC transporter permease subunit [Sinorhizobium medicae]MDX0433428.1 ABC transporter permease subunit [Sinorhizobium medicae]MDX0439338.1 ABC transporter permease subunit [Sinorhizobium medicae]
MPLISVVLGRLSQAFLLLIAMSLIGFIGVHSVGNPVFNVVNIETATPEDIRQATIALGLDQPIWRQYLLFINNVVRGNFGTSYIYHLPAFALVMSKLPATLELACVAMLIAAPVGTGLGLLAGRRSGTIFDRTVLRSSVFALSIPSFWLSMMLILLGAILTGWFPSGGRGTTARFLGQEWSFLTGNGLWHMVLPALALAIPNVALIARLSRSGTIEVENLDFTRFCRAKGLSSRRILLRHTLPNISVPIVTIIGLQFGGMLAFAVVVESIFAWPGVGKLLIDSIQLLDRPVVMATLTFISVAFVALNALVDLFYAVLDPRVRLS